MNKTKKQLFIWEKNNKVIIVIFIKLSYINYKLNNNPSIGKKDLLWVDDVFCSTDLIILN
jgi:hypothetical protein